MFFTPRSRMDYEYAKCTSPDNELAEVLETISLILGLGLTCCQSTAESLFSAIVVLPALCAWESCRNGLQ